MAWLFLALGLLSALLTFNTYRPAYKPPVLSGLSFFAGWLMSELPLHHLAGQIVTAALFLRAGVLAQWPGTIAMPIWIASWIGLVVCFLRGFSVAPIVLRALRDNMPVGWTDSILPAVRDRFGAGVEWPWVVAPFPIRHPEVERIPNLKFARVGKRDIALDVYRHRSRPTGCPVLLQVHGGGWVIGSKNEQGLPLMLHMAARGWVCVSADYRLSPHATFPDHLVDLKRAIAWIKEHAAEYGGDPDFIVVTGGSAGGHLASLVALTANAPAYQPGFESVDTTVRGCVPFYGVYDFTDRHGHWHHEGLIELLERRVMKTSLRDAHDVFDQASPRSRVHAEAPPFFIVHGDRDTLVPVAEARDFAHALREVSRQPVVYVEIPGAQHAYEIFPSLRALLTIQGVERFLGWVYSQYAAARPHAEAEADQRLAG